MNPLGIKIEKGCVVDASHKDEWWTGLVIKEIEADDKFLVLFDSPLDIVLFERKSLRLHFDVPSLTDPELLRRLTEESVFSSGTMVEVSSKRDEIETVWVPAMFVKEIDDKKKCIVKFCDKDLSFVTGNSSAIKTVDLRSIRPSPPPVSVKEYRLQQYVEVRHWKEWRQARFVRFHNAKWCGPGKWCVVLLLATNKESMFKLSDLRPLQVWEDGVWKTMESSSGNKMVGSAINAKEAGPHVTPFPGIAAFPWKQTEAKIQGNTLPPIRMQNRWGNDIRQESETSEDDNRKRKREENVTTVTNVDESKAKKKTEMVLPFEKTLEIWKNLDSMEVFKTFPQSPHFIPLLETREEESREMAAVSLMFTYATLIHEVRGLQRFHLLISKVEKVIHLSNSLAMLENHGFDVKAPQSRIHNLLSLRDKHLKKTEERKGVEKRIANKERELAENKCKILELLKLNEEASKELAQMKSSAATINQELKAVDLESTIWNP